MVNRFRHAGRYAVALALFISLGAGVGPAQPVHAMDAQGQPMNLASGSLDIFTGEGANTEDAKAMMSLKSTIRKQWQLPADFNGQPSIMMFTLSNTGQLASVKTIRSSGNAQSDALAEDAVRTAVAKSAIPAGLYGKTALVGSEPPKPYQMTPADDTYIIDLTRRLKSRWSLPNSVADADIPLEIFIARDGGVLYRGLKHSSGSQDVDKATLMAFDSLTPLPPLPSSYPQEFMHLTLDLDYRNRTPKAVPAAKKPAPAVKKSAAKKTKKAWKKR